MDIFYDHIEEARAVALTIDRTFKHVSLIFRRNKLVSVGINQKKTHPLAKKYGYRFDEIHSELDAFLRLKVPKNRLVLVNYRFNNQGDLRGSAPCCKCIVWCDALFDRIYHSITDGGTEMK